jgi:uncharacterized membrane protein YhhN
MKPKQFRIFLATAFFCILDLLLVATKNDELRFFSKPFIIPCIAGIYFFSFENNNIEWKKDMILLGLTASWLGDILLQFDNLFIPGLLSFLLAHIFYIRFLVHTKSENTSFFKLRPVMLIAVLAYLIELMNLLWPHLGPMKIPVLIYGITISVMLSSAMWQYQKLEARTSLFLITGAAFFVASDSILAINKFKTHFEYSGILIMTTYIIAQLFIVMGAIRYRTTE